jgi:hypothetical protein
MLADEYGMSRLATELWRPPMDGCEQLPRGLQNRLRLSVDVRSRSHLFANVRCVAWMTANDSQVCPPAASCR